MLKKRKYLPEGMEDAVQTVMTQCEPWTDNNDMGEESVSTYEIRERICVIINHTGEIMEYYILKCYEKAQNERLDVERGLNRFTSKTKMIVIVCFIVMLASYVWLFVTMLAFQKPLGYCIGMMMLSVAMVVLMIIDTKDTKKHIDKYVNLNNEKLEILEAVLKNEFAIESKEKIEELMDIYQEYIDKKKDNEKERNRIILIVFSALAGVLTISFENMKTIGIDFGAWLYLAVFLILFVAIAVSLIYACSFFDTLKRKYEMMLHDLRGLLLIKY